MHILPQRVKSGINGKIWQYSICALFVPTPYYINVSSMNLEQSKLTVNGTFNCNGGLLWEKAICSQGCQCIDHEVLDASVPRMLHLSNVLQLIIDGFDDGSLSKQKLVGNAHQGSLHVVLQFGYQLYPVHKETLKQILADISFVTDKFSIEHFHECLVVQRLPVVNITWCNHEVQQLTFLITNQMKFEAEEPSHGAFASLGYSLESLVYVYTLVTAYPKRCAVYKTDSRALTQKNLLDKYGQRYGHIMLKFDKAVIGDCLWERMASEKDRLEDIRQLLDSTAEGQEEQLTELLHDDDVMDDVRTTVYLRQALLRHHAQEIMPQADVNDELKKFQSRMRKKQLPTSDEQPTAARIVDLRQKNVRNKVAEQKNAEQDTVDRKNIASKDVEATTEKQPAAVRKTIFSRPLLWGLVPVAACLLLLFGASWWFQTHQPEENPDIAYDIPRNQLTEPSIITSKGKVIPMKNTGQNISMAGSNLSARNRLLRALGYDADEVSTEKCSIAVPPGKSYDIVLADGTKVWLYADSKLTYPLSFTGKERAVYLQGQAEFDVTHDPSHPFVIITDKMDVRVLGTELNVSCYPGEAAHVALLRGVVVVSGRKGEHSVTLKPGQGATMMGAGTFSVAEENMEPYEYWKNGYLYYDDQPLEVIAKSLSRWYRVQFVFDNPALEKKRLRFFCLRSEGLPRALELLNHFSGIDAKQQADGVHIK